MITFLFFSLFAKQLPLWQEFVVREHLETFRTEIIKCRGEERIWIWHKCTLGLNLNCFGFTGWNMELNSYIWITFLLLVFAGTYWGLKFLFGVFCLFCCGLLFWVCFFLIEEVLFEKKCSCIFAKLHWKICDGFYVFGFTYMKIAGKR